MRRKWIGVSVGAVAVASTSVLALAVLRTGDAACAATRREAPAPGVGYTGQATHYEIHGGGGNCSYPAPPADELYVALSPGSTQVPVPVAATWTWPGRRAPSG